MKKRVHLGLLVVLATLTGAAAQPRYTAIHTRETWQRLGGPPGGLGYDIRMRPDNPDVMFVTDAYGGIHRSTDGGATWTAVNTGIETCTWCGAAIFCATIDPHNYDTMWIGTQNTGHVYRSIDNGDSWIERDTGIRSDDKPRSVRGITVDPLDPAVVFAALEVSLSSWADGAPHGAVDPRGAPTGGEVYKTTDAGATWNLVWEGPSLARYVWIDPHNTARVYVSTGMFDRDAANSNKPTGIGGGVGILRSDDGGLTWAVLDESGGLGGKNVPSLFMHPTDPQTLLAAVTATIGQTSGAYVTYNGGDSWQRVLEPGPVMSVEAVEISTTDPNVWYVAQEGGIFRSGDAGHHWIWYPVATERRAGVPIDLQADPRNPMRIFVNNYGGGNFLSTDGGATWLDASRGYTGAAVMGLAVLPGDGADVLSTGIFNIVTPGFRSRDGGTTWKASLPDSGPIVVRSAPGRKPPRLWMGSGTGRVYRSTDGGTTWESAMLHDAEAAFVRALAVAPSDDRTVYAAFGNPKCYSTYTVCYETAYGAFRSRDGGVTFQPLPSADFATMAVLAFAIDPLDPRKLYAGGARSLHVSFDGGDNWQDVPAFDAAVAQSVTDPGAYQVDQGGVPIVYDVALDPFDARVMYAASLPGIVLRSVDGGASWSQIAAGMDPNEPIVALRADPNRRGVLYAASQQSGVFMTTDGGARWHQLNPGFAVPTAQSLALSDDGTVLYAGSAKLNTGAGLFRLGTPHGLKRVSR